MVQQRTIYSGLEHLKLHFNSFNKLYDLCLDGDYNPWYSMGYWDESLIPYFLVEHNQVIANVSVAPMNMIIKNKEYKTLQISAVMTLPDYRNQGLSKYLMQHILEAYKESYDFLYLFANEEVLEFYPKFGFERLDESSFTLNNIKFDKSKSTNYRKLSIENDKDLALLERLSEKHNSVSHTLSFKANKALSMYHFLLQFEESLYYYDKLDCLVIMEYDEQHLTIYDIFTSNAYDLTTLIQSLIKEKTEEVNFFFIPNENFNNKLIVESNPFDEDALFIYPGAKKELLPKHFIFPITSHY